MSDSIAFDRAAGYYDQSRGLPAEAEELVADRILGAVGPGACMVELGVGTGRIALPLHRRGRAPLGIDLSVPMLERYRAKAVAAGLAPPPVLRADVARLPLPHGRVDAVIEVHVLHLVPSWRRALAETRRVLAPRGMVLLGRGGGWSRNDGPRDQVGRRFEALVAQAGAAPRRVGVADDDHKVAELTDMGGVAESLEPVRWKETETYAQALDLVERRVFSSMWQLPDEVWRVATARLRAEVEAAHPDLDAPHKAIHSFTLTAVRF